MKTVVTITGIRPEFIRLAATIKLLDADPDINHILVHTGQHFDRYLSEEFFKELNIRSPDYNLMIGELGKEHFLQTADLCSKVINLFRTEHINPDLIILLGDANTVTGVATLYKEGYKICHIEAGMRSFDKRMHEEINRTICDHCSHMLLVYHPNYVQKLDREGINSSNAQIHVVGNTIVEPCKPIVERLAQQPKRNSHIIVDVHRPENFLYKDRLQQIFDYANLIGDRYKLPVYYLAYTRTMYNIHGLQIDVGSAICVPLKSFTEYTQATYDARAIVSDSGTAQEEAALFQTHCVVPRDFTERPESLSSNCSYQLFLDQDLSKADQVFEYLDTPFCGDVSWLGEGKTSVLIHQHVRTFLKI